MHCIVWEQFTGNKKNPATICHMIQETLETSYWPTSDLFISTKIHNAEVTTEGHG